MSRPLKIGLSYFPHDTNAVSDHKLQALMALYGCDGYAFYFILLEQIYNTEEGRFPCGKPTEKAGISRIIGITVKKFEAILASSLEIGCFNSSEWNANCVLTSDGIQKRLEIVNNLRLKERQRKESLKDKDKYKIKRKHNSRKTLVLHTENSNPLELESDYDKKNNIKHIYGEYKHVLLTDEQYVKIKDKFGDDTERVINNLDEGIELKGYKYKNHYLAILKWNKNEQAGKPDPDEKYLKLMEDKPSKWLQNIL